MKKITIYAKGKNNIERFNVLIYDQYLLKLLEKLDNYYGVQIDNYFGVQKELKKVEEYFGLLIQDLEEDEFYELVSSELINCNTDYNVYKYTVRRIKSVGLSKIVREILNSDHLKASYAVKKLYKYSCKDDEEKELLNDIKSCLHFKKNNKKFDLTKLFLDFERKLLEYDINMKFIDNKTDIKTDNIPYSYVFNKKHE